jgi:hypothetical protein
MPEGILQKPGAALVSTGGSVGGGAQEKQVVTTNVGAVGRAKSIGTPSPTAPPTLATPSSQASSLFYALLASILCTQCARHCATPWTYIISFYPDNKMMTWKLLSSYYR